MVCVQPRMRLCVFIEECRRGHAQGVAISGCLKRSSASGCE